MTIPTLDLQAQFREVETDVRAAIERVLASQRFVLGPEGEALEREIAAYSGIAHAVGVSSGTDAILAGLMALAVGPGDEVVTTPYTFVATTGCIARLGARAVFVDIDPVTFALDAARLDAAIGARTRAILPVHLFGQMADMTAIQRVASARSIPVIQDAAQAIGARRDGRPVGRGSSLATLSFYPSKNLGCMGDGGMVLTDDGDLATRVRLIRNHGQEPKHTSHVVGGNFRLDEIQAAVLRAKLPRLDRWIAARQEHAQRYRAAFSERRLDPEWLTLPREAANVRHVYNQFVIRTPRRDALQAHLTRCGIGCAVYYPRPMHLQPCFASWGYSQGQFPEAERASRETLALPLYPEAHGHLDRAHRGRGRVLPRERRIPGPPVTNATCFVHPTAVVDTPVTIGEGTRIWHFCHVSAGATLGPRCNLGQNVFIAPNVRLGAGVKVQNNVSIYEGVEPRTTSSAGRRASSPTLATLAPRSRARASTTARSSGAARPSEPTRPSSAAALSAGMPSSAPGPWSHAGPCPTTPSCSASPPARPAG